MIPVLIILVIIQAIVICNLSAKAKKSIVRGHSFSVDVLVNADQCHNELKLIEERSIRILKNIHEINRAAEQKESTHA